MKSTLLTLLLISLIACNPRPSTKVAVLTAVSSTNEILYFFDPHCPDCKEIEASYLDVLAERAGCLPEEIQRLDATTLEGAQALLAAQGNYGFACNVLAPVLVIRGNGLCGVQQIRAEAEWFEGESQLVR